MMIHRYMGFSYEEILMMPVDERLEYVRIHNKIQKAENDRLTNG